ncbi:MAG: AMP-binding protein [Gallionella sp.]|jgi:acyl-coenzyme A synthetase/AMP-(fatty) acid ligase
MTTLPLLAHTSPDSIVAHRADGAVTRQQFLSEAHQLASLFPPGSHLLNLCGNRYRFSVGLAAAIMAGKVSLLPPTQTPEVVRQIKLFAPDVFCLTDSNKCTVDLPQLHYPAMNVSTPCEVPQIVNTQHIAVVFTSGSTGIPQPHPKTWGALVDSVQAEAQRLAVTQDCALIGTVPPQHMYGFESTVLMAWCSGAALSHAQPFYPADICQTLSAVPMPRVLISSPLHLRALLDAGLALPELAGVVSATAPMPAQLAHEVETRCNTKLMEIYGSTETGQIATRRPTQGAAWQLFPGIKWLVKDDCVHACGDHIDAPIAMNDRIEPITDKLFLLHGRLADLVNIAGKRHSLASLDHLLNSLPGVVDGAFFMPDDAGHVTRLAAVVVAPGMDATTLLAALREHIDPVFLPRPLLFVDALPRNSTGKLPRAALQTLFQART